MKNTKGNFIHFLSAMSFSSLLLTVSGQLTDSNDATFPILSFSFGDPCLPTPYPWVKCNSDVTPRVTALILGKQFLTPSLPDFSAMDALEIIDFSDNALIGEFPDFLANFPKLKVLNLANNFLSGTVPTSLRDKSIANTLKLTLTGEGRALCFSDEYACGTETRPGTGTPGPGTPGTGTPGTEIGASGTATNSPVTPTKSRSKTIAIGIGTPIFVIFCAVVTFLAIDHQKRKALAEAAQGQTNKISVHAMPVYADTDKQTQPMV